MSGSVAEMAPQEQENGKLSPVKVALAVLATILAGWIAGALLLTIAYSIPTEAMRPALLSSSATLQAEGNYPNIDGTDNTRLDNFTDAAMLGFAGIPNGSASPLESAMESLGPKTAENKWGPRTALKRMLEEEGETGGYTGATHSYKRYWHGYLTWLKPALALGLDLNAIRVVNAVIQAALAIAIIALLVRRRRTVLVPAFLVAVLSIRCWMVPLSLQYSSVFSVALIATLVLLAVRPRFRSQAGKALFITMLFLITGMLTSFTDLLTYPLFALGLPLLVMVGTEDHLNKGQLKRTAVLMAIACVSWGVGYAAMWVGKWILASIVLQENAFASALSAAATRSSSKAKGRKINALLTLMRNGKHYLDPALLGAMGIVLVAYVARIAMLVKQSRTSLSEVICNGIPFVAIALMPVLWYAAFKNHSYVHHFFAYRELALSFGAIVFAFALPAGQAGNRPRPAHTADR